MVPLTALAVPILLSAVLVFLASSLIHMVLNWHKNDLDRLPDEDRVMDALRPFNLRPGNYAMPKASSMADLKDPAFKAKFAKGPNALITIMPTGEVTMGKALTLWFILSVIVGIFAAYIAGRALPYGAQYLDVFRFVGTTAFLGYSLALVHDSIWWHRKWSSTIKNLIDGLIYALLTAGTFGWLWPTTPPM